ncbi:hypothetical protein [Desulfotruncus alcoholivorax]|uniref:hypothetical protein n=1 Tax=Desulfotruncus alcoholivorax TaxID=265477 RepID=UPI00041889B2|nr:hypothetical protein [Desulfotruncus alcoholivorax]
MPVDQYYSTSSFYESPFVPLIIGMIALIFLAPLIDTLYKMIEAFIQKALNRFSFLPDNVADEIAFVLVVSIGYVVCWQGEFDFFSYLNFNFDSHLGWFLTSLSVSGGTSALRNRFDLMNLIPMSIGSGLSSTMMRIIGKKGEK